MSGFAAELRRKRSAALTPEAATITGTSAFRTGVHVDEAVMGLSVHADGDGEGENPLLGVA